MRFGLFASVVLASAGISAPSLGASIVKGPWVQRVGSTSAEVRVEVDPPSSVSVEIGLPEDGADASSDTKMEARRLESSDRRSLHAIRVSDLLPGRRYPLVVRTPTGAERAGTLRTAPSDDSVAPFRFAAYGDNRSDEAAHASVVRAIRTSAPDFLVHTGDFVENGGSKADWQTFFDVEAPLLRDRAIVSCVGNHELIDGAGAQYVRYFGPSSFVGAGGGGASARSAEPVDSVSLEDLAGTFRWGNTRFFLLNGMVQHRAGASRAWLEKVLSDADREPHLQWRVVVVHHGLWSSGPHGNNARLLEARIPDLLRAHQVDVIFAGHDHIYERGVAEGLPYVVTGGGGAPLYRIRSKLPSARRVESVHHFVDVEVTPTALRMTAIRPDGSVLERCGLAKGTTGWDCDDVSAASARASTEQAGEASARSSSVTQTSAGGAAPVEEPRRPSSRCACRFAGARAPSSPRGMAVVGLFAGAFFVRRRSRAILAACVRFARSQRR